MAGLRDGRERGSAEPDRGLILALHLLASGRVSTGPLIEAAAEREGGSWRLLEILVARGVLTAAEAADVERELNGIVGPDSADGPTLGADPNDEPVPQTVEADPLPTLSTAAPLIREDPYATRADASLIDPYATQSATRAPVDEARFRSTGFDAGEVAAAEQRRFHRLRLLARGGLGAVFVAYDGELNREVAIKEILERAADDPNSRARFLLEAEITGSLEHPGIVPVYGLGQYRDGRPFYAMRLIQGETLAAAIQAYHRDPETDPGARALALRKLLSRFIAVCNALAYAHSKGIVHRDIKPSNIMLGKFGETLIVDWGLAKRVGQPEPNDRTGPTPPDEGGPDGLVATLKGASFGTPRFMSPEQACGDLERIGPASDIYSLGASLYVVLTDRPPFDGLDLAQIVEGTLAGRFVRPRDLNRAVPPALEAICLKAMALDPLDRYTSSRAMADDLERWLADEPVSAYREPAAIRLRRWVRTRRTLVTSVLVACVIATLGTAYGFYAQSVLEANRKARALGWVRTIIRAEIGDLPQVIDQARTDREWVEPAVLARLEDPKLSPRGQLHLTLALVELDPTLLNQRLDTLYEALLRADELQLPVIRDALASRSSVLIPRLRGVLDDFDADRDRRFNAACALATYAPPVPGVRSEAWDPYGPFLTEVCLDKIVANASRFGTIRQTLKPAASVMFESLLDVFSDHDPARSNRRAFARSLLDDSVERSDERVELLLAADLGEVTEYLDRLQSDPAGAVARLAEELRVEPDPSWDVMPPDPLAVPIYARASARRHEALAVRRGQAGAALVRLGRGDLVWPRLRHSADPSVRTELIHRFARMGVPAVELAARLASEPDVSGRRALILALGEYPPSALSELDRRKLVDSLLAEFRQNPDPGLHSAIDWLLRTRWGEASRLEEVKPPGQPEGRDWLINGQGQTLAIVRGPVEGEVGAPISEPWRGVFETRHRVKVERTFAIGTREVTAREYLRFLDDNPDLRTLNPASLLDPDGPTLSVNFFDAARYCNWLSAREGIPESQWCYPVPVARGMTLPSDYLHRTGYRLPTQVEWELAARAGANTARYFGVSAARSDQYAWTRGNAESRPKPVGLLKPNDLGLFDVLGNAWEWTLDTAGPLAIATRGPSLDVEGDPLISDDAARILRGGSFDYGPEMSRLATNPGLTPSSRYYTLGIRVARTLPAGR
jgi:formylglycine-generating enzyme required for sulfatase activity